MGKGKNGNWPAVLTFPVAIPRLPAQPTATGALICVRQYS